MLPELSLVAVDRFAEAPERRRRALWRVTISSDQSIRAKVDSGIQWLSVDCRDFCSKA
jgi:hypothetical protein